MPRSSRCSSCRPAPTQLSSTLSDRRLAGLCGNHVPPLAQRARSLFLARRDRGAAGLGRASRQVRAGLDRPRARQGRSGAPGVREPRARGLLALASGRSAGGGARVRRARRRALRQGGRGSLAVFLRRALTAPLAVFVSWSCSTSSIWFRRITRVSSPASFRHRDRGARARRRDERARARRSGAPAGQLR